MEHPDVATYYRQIFEHDWKVAERAPGTRSVRPALPGEPTPTGMLRFKFWDYFDWE